MARRSKQPNPLRFLQGVIWGSSFLAILAVVHFLFGLACELSGKATCTEVPGTLILTCLLLFTAGALYSVYRYYRDHMCGDLLR